MNIELGKTYRTRDGGKARVICVDAVGDQRIIALHLNKKGCETLRYHNHDGRWLLIEEDGNDLVSEWTDKPTYDPATFPKWKWAAVDGDGKAWAYTSKPIKLTSRWILCGRGGMLEIPTPKDYNGDWENSLVELP